MVENKFVKDIQSFKGGKPMSREGTELFAKAIMAEMSDQKIEIPQSDKSFIMKVIEKRIEVMKLPIKFTPLGLVAAEVLTEGNVGSAVVMVIDCLTVYENQTVDVDKLARLYPMGFYRDDVFTDYIDNYLKPKKVKWAEVY